MLCWLHTWQVLCCCSLSTGAHSVILRAIDSCSLTSLTTERTRSSCAVCRWIHHTSAAPCKLQWARRAPSARPTLYCERLSRSWLAISFRSSTPRRPKSAIPTAVHAAVTVKRVGTLLVGAAQTQGCSASAFQMLGKPRACSVEYGAEQLKPGPLEVESQVPSGLNFICTSDIQHRRSGDAVVGRNCERVRWLHGHVALGRPVNRQGRQRTTQGGAH